MIFLSHPIPFKVARLLSCTFLFRKLKVSLGNLERSRNCSANFEVEKAVPVKGSSLPRIHGDTGLSSSCRPAAGLAVVPCPGGEPAQTLLSQMLSFPVGLMLGRTSRAVIAGGGGRGVGLSGCSVSRSPPSCFSCVCREVGTAGCFPNSSGWQRHFTVHVWVRALEHGEPPSVVGPSPCWWLTREVPVITARRPLHYSPRA